MLLRRLYPEPGNVPAEEAVRWLRLGEMAHEDRPYLVLNMVATLDGRIAIAGRSGSIGNEADTELFHGLRTQADAVMVGAGTARIERYGRMVRKPERRGHRVEEGLAPDPKAVLVSARLGLPEDLPLLQDADSHVLIATASDAELPPVPATVEYLRAPRDTTGAGIPLAPLLRELHTRGVRSVLCEGGPALNDGLLRERLVDELFLSLAP